jgi:hypothetical protein
MSLIHSGNSFRTPSGGAHWPNLHTVNTTALVAMNFACYFFNSPVATAAIVNLPMRCFSMYQTPSFKRCYKFPMDIVAFVVLPIPHGILFAIGLDVVAEVLNYYDNRKENISHTVSSTKRLDPTKSDNACKILNVQPGEEKDQVKVKSRCDTIVQEYETKKKGLSEPLAQGMQQLIEDAKKAYLTITGQPYPTE